MSDYIVVGGIRVSEEFISERFGRLLTIGNAFIVRADSGGTVLRQVCACDCGGKVVARVVDLRRGVCQSCGCIKKETLRSRVRKHGESGKSREYSVWSNMRQRCNNASDRAYSFYGGRGIKICDRWQCDEGFSNFLHDMGRSPSKNHSIDRIDVDGDYCPENCRWATNIEQSRNRRTNRLLTYKGETRCLVDHAALHGINKATLVSRLNSGMTIEEATELPIVKHKRKSILSGVIRKS